MITLILVDTSLELIPAELCKVGPIKKEASRKNKKIRHLILDSARHRPYIVEFNLKDKDKRGRPDILHRFLLFTLGSLASKKGKLRVFVHTLFNETFETNRELRLPRNYVRFIGLFEQFLVKKKVPLKGEPLMTLKKQTLKELLDEINPERVVLLSSKGKIVKMNEYLNLLDDISGKNYVFLIGGFPFGEVSDLTKELVDEIISISEESLSSTVTAAELIVNYENLVL